MKRLSILITGLGLGGMLLLTTGAIYTPGGGTVSSNSVYLLGFVPTNFSGTANIGTVIVTNAITNAIFAGFSNTNPATGNRTLVAPTNTPSLNDVIIASSTSGNTKWGVDSSSQTPWVANINAASFQLSNIYRLLGTNSSFVLGGGPVLVLGTVGQTAAFQVWSGTHWGDITGNTNGTGIAISGTNSVSANVSAPIVTFGGNGSTLFTAPYAITNNPNTDTNLFEARGTNGAQLTIDRGAGLQITGAAGTNWMDFLAVTNTLNARTNIGLVDISTNNFVLATRITNGVRRLFATASITLTAAAAGTAKATLYAEYAGVLTNKVSVSAGPLASLVTVEELMLPVGPGAIYYILDETSGAGASVSVLAGAGSVVFW